MKDSVQSLVVFHLQQDSNQGPHDLSQDRVLTTWPSGHPERGKKGIKGLVTFSGTPIICQ